MCSTNKLPILLPTYQWWHRSWGVDLLYTVHYCTPIKLSLCAKTIFCSWCITYKKQNDAIYCINKLKRIIIRQTKHKDKNCVYLKHERLYETTTLFRHYNYCKYQSIPIKYIYNSSPFHCKVRNANDILVI